MNVYLLLISSIFFYMYLVTEKPEGKMKQNIILRRKLGIARFLINILPGIIGGKSILGTENHAIISA